MTANERRLLLHHAYHKLKYYYDGSRAMRHWHTWFEAADASDSGEPYGEFSGLRRLETVKSVGPPELKALNRHKYGGRYAGFTRTELETFTRFVLLDWFDHISHLDIFLLALYRSGNSIGNLMLGGLTQINLKSSPRIRTLNLRSLVLDLRVSEADEMLLYREYSSILLYLFRLSQ